MSDLGDAVPHHTGSSGGEELHEPALAEQLAAAALAVEGVTALHGGSFGEVATYLPGRRVTGIRVRDSGASVHLTVAFGSDLRQVGEAVRRAVTAIADTPVEVVVEDVAVA